MMAGLPPAIRLSGIGFYVALCIAGGVIGGVQLDRLLGTGRVFAIVGLFLGLALALGGGYVLLLEVLNKRGGREGQ